MKWLLRNGRTIAAFIKPKTKLRCKWTDDAFSTYSNIERLNRLVPVQLDKKKSQFKLNHIDLFNIFLPLHYCFLRPERDKDGDSCELFTLTLMKTFNIDANEMKISFEEKRWINAPNEFISELMKWYGIEARQTKMQETVKQTAHYVCLSITKRKKNVQCEWEYVYACRFVWGA